MRILLDESVPRQLARALHGHQVRTIRQVGWSGVDNGALLYRAALEFDAFITLDRNLQFQQPLDRFNIGIIVLNVPDSRAPTIRALAPSILDSLRSLRAGDLVQVGP